MIHLTYVEVSNPVCSDRSCTSENKGIWLDGIFRALMVTQRVSMRTWRALGKLFRLWGALIAWTIGWSLLFMGRLWTLQMPTWEYLPSSRVRSFERSAWQPSRILHFSELGAQSPKSLAFPEWRMLHIFFTWLSFLQFTVVTWDSSSTRTYYSIPSADYPTLCEPTKLFSPEFDLKWTRLHRLVGP
jgi:hypothetical protein